MTLKERDSELGMEWVEEEPKNPDVETIKASFAAEERKVDTSSSSHEGRRKVISLSGLDTRYDTGHISI